MTKKIHKKVQKMIKKVYYLERKKVPKEFINNSIFPVGFFDVK